MKEGGINAAEGANALKSGLASIINPSGKAADMLASVGINIREIVEKNGGDLRNTVLGVAEALNTLRPLDRARAIEQLFGKFQFSRISTLFANIVNEGTQASRVLDLTEMSMSDLATTADKELGITADSTMNKFKKTVEDLRASLVPVGQAFLEAITPILETLNNVLSGFKDMSTGSKKAITLLITIIGGLGPVLLMTFGLLANGLANILKLFAMLRGGYLKLGGQTNVLGEQTQYLTSEQLEAAAVASSLDQSHARLTQRFTVEKVAVDQLRDAYIQATGAALRFAVNNPGLMATPKKYAKGISLVPGTGNKDTVPSLLTPGEAVIPAPMVKKYGPLIQGMIADNIPGFAEGKFPSMQGGIQRMLAPYTMFAPGNVAGGFGMTSSFLSQTGFAESLRNTAIASGAVEGDIKLTQSVINDMATEIMPYSEQITNALRDTSKRLIDAGTPAKHISELFAQSEQEIKKILDSMRQQGGRIASSAVGLQKFAYPTTEDIMSGGYARVPGVTVDPATGRVVKSTIYSNKKGKSGAFDRRLKSVSRTQPIQSSGILTKAHVVPENLGIIAGATALQGAATKLPMEKQMAARAEIDRKGAVVAGRKYAEAYSSGLDQGGLKDIYLESRDRKSPHRFAAQDGRDDAVAYQKAKSSKLLTYGTTGPVSAIDKSIRRQNEKRLKDLSANMSVTGGMLGAYGLGSAGNEQQKEVKQSTRNLQGMNSALMSGTFALTSLSAMGSMTGGKLGDLSQKIMKYSGSLFALMTVTQLLTQAKITELAATRMSIARSFQANAMAAGSMFGGASKSIFSKGGLLGSLARGGLMVAKFLGPIGIATTVVTGFVIGLRLYNKGQEEARRKLLAFGNALTTTKKQAESTGKYFGVTLKKSNLAIDNSSQVEAGKTDLGIRGKIDEFKESDEFIKDYAETVKDLKNLNDVDTKTALLVRIQNLIGQGYSEEQIQIIISSLQEAASKTGIKLNFKEINIDTLNKDILEGLKPKLTSLSKFAGGKGLSKSFIAGYDPRSRGIVTKEVVTQTKEYSDALTNVGMSVKSVLDNLSLLQKEGKISGVQLNESFTMLMTNIKIQAGDAATQILLVNKALEGFDNPISKAAAGTDNLTKKTKLLQAAMLGAIIPTAVLQGYLNGGTVLAMGGRVDESYFEKQIDDIIKKATEFQNKFNKSILAGTKVIPDGSKEDSALTKLKKQTKEVQTQTTVYKQLRKAGIDAATAQELAANVDLAKQLNATKFLGKNWNDAVKAIKDYTKKQQQLEKTIAVGGGAGEYQQYLFKKAEAFIALQEQLIDMQYKDQLKSIDVQTRALGDQLDNIKLQEDQINEKFDKQIGALNTIKTLNENIANQEKQRLTIADALSRGDISAAAVAIQEARSQQASASMEAAQQGLTTGKENAIASLGAKKIQQQIDALNKQKNVIEDTIEKQKESIKYFGMTADQIRDAARALDLANDAGIDINNPTFLNNLINGAKGDASALKAVMISLQDEARKLFDELNKLRSTFLTTTAPAGGGGSYYSNLSNELVGTPGYEGMSARQIEAERRRESGNRYMYGGIIKKYAAGGIVSGKGMTDKVPALLTPGEYVVNKNASRKFGPLLKSINESKYPGSMSTVGASSVLGISSNAVNNNSTSVYNYSLNIDASGGSANPNDIARIVMTQIKNMDAQRIRGNRY
jgi:archaellum component FlaC